MKLEILGCSGSATQGNNTTSFLVNDRLLIDAGTGVRKLSVDKLRNIKDIVITHSHLDHIVYLPFIADTLFNSINSPITIHCLKETSEHIQQNIFNDYIWPDFFSIKNNNNHPVFKIKPIEAEKKYSIAELNVETVAANHTVPAIGLRVEDDGKSFAFTGDTTTNDSFWKMINNYPKLDFLIAECAFPNSQKNIAQIAKHYYPQTLCADLKKCNIETKILISHMKADTENIIMKEIHELTGGEFHIKPLEEGKLSI